MQSTRFSCQILLTLHFSRPILQKHYIPNLMNIRPVGGGFMMRTDIQLHIQNVIDSFAILQTRLIKRPSWRHHSFSWSLYTINELPWLSTILSRLFDQCRTCDPSWSVMSNPTLKISNYFIYILGVHLYRTLKGNIFYAHDNRDMPIYLVLSLITSDKLANNQEFDIHVIQLTRF